MIWKPTDLEKKRIKGFAAQSEKRKPTRLHMRIGERYSLTRGINANSTNVMLIDDTIDWEDSDLFQTCPWSDLKNGIELTKEGRAQVDFYVYERTYDDYGDLLTNVQAHVALRDGKPVLWKITGTGVPAKIVDEVVAGTLSAEQVGVDG
jgi:hypothetical protein